jgi:hypothetical protein
MAGRRRVGGPTSSVEYSPARILRMARSRERQERRWAALAGAVVVRTAVEGKGRSPKGGSAPLGGRQ